MTTKRTRDEIELDGSSATAATITATAAAVDNNSCRICGENGFPSRNKLFKHLKKCSSNQEFLKSNATATAKDAAADFSDMYFYVTGGRLRGRTLGSVERYSFSKKSWETAPSMIENRGSHGAIGVGNKIYVLGGGGFRSNLATCELFDCSTSTWATIAPMATYRHALAVSYMPANSSIYAVGGWINGSVCSAHLERFDLVSGAWTTCSPMKVARRLLGAASIGGILYVFGGNCDDHDNTEKNWYSDAVESYDSSTDSWTTRKSLPFVGPCCAVAVGEYIFVLMHGRNVLRYCPRSDSYTALADLPLAEWFCFDATAYGSTIYVHGGASQGVWSKAFYAYDTLTDSWTELPQMLRQRRRCAAAIVHHNNSS